MATAPLVIPENDPKNPVPFPLPRLAGPDSIPAHVPEELVRSVGIPFSPEFNADPYAFFAKMHETLPPIYYDVGPVGNAWQLLKHEDAFFALRHGEYFSSASATPFPRDPNDYFYFLPIEIDPPMHRKYRAIVDPMVNPQAVLKWEERIRKLSNDLIDAVIDKGECEFADDFARPLPVCVFLDLMGLPQEMRDQFVTWVVALLKNMDPAKMIGVMAEIGAYLKTAIADKRANPDEGMISRIVHAAPDGEPLSEKEVFGFVFFVFIAGLRHAEQHLVLAGAQSRSAARDDCRSGEHQRSGRGIATRSVGHLLWPDPQAGPGTARRPDESGRPHHLDPAGLQLRSRRFSQPDRGRLPPSAQANPRFRGRSAQLHGRAPRPAGDQDRPRGVVEAYPRLPGEAGCGNQVRA
jgi:hypothetical protein